MTITTISLPVHLKEWLQTQKIGASEWIRIRIEREMEQTTSKSAIKAALEVEMQEARRHLDELERLEYEELKAKKQQDSGINLRKELVALKLSMGKISNDIYYQLYRYYQETDRMFNPVSNPKDVATLYYALKEELDRIKAETEQAKKEVDRLLNAKPKED